MEGSLIHTISPLRHGEKSVQLIHDESMSRPAFTFTHNALNHINNKISIIAVTLTLTHTLRLVVYPNGRECDTHTIASPTHVRRVSIISTRFSFTTSAFQD